MACKRHRHKSFCDGLKLPMRDELSAFSKEQLSRAASMEESVCGGWRSRLKWPSEKLKPRSLDMSLLIRISKSLLDIKAMNG